MISFRCPECREEVEIADRMAGEKTQCPDCGARVAVPANADHDEAGDEWHSSPPRADPASHKRRELLEWLGLTPADLLVYLAMTAIAAMFFVHDSTADALLAAIGILLATVACPIGMKRDAEMSDLTNGMKFWAYPVCVVLAVAAVIVHYARFNN